MDGLGIVPDLLTRHSSRPTEWWGYHHLLCHNLGFAMLVTILGASLAKRRLVAGALCCASVHLHFFCDVVGARGPDGYQWPIPYLLPFAKGVEWTWSGQWALNAWPNIAITFLLLVSSLVLAVRRGCSPLEMFSKRADAAVVEALRKRFARE